MGSWKYDHTYTHLLAHRGRLSQKTERDMQREHMQSGKTSIFRLCMLMIINTRIYSKLHQCSSKWIRYRIKVVLWVLLKEPKHVRAEIRPTKSSSIWQFAIVGLAAQATFMESCTRKSNKKCAKACIFGESLNLSTLLIRACCAHNM